MIFVTASKGLFFERLIKKADEISAQYSIEIVVQGGYEYQPESKQLTYFTTLPREQFEEYFENAKLVISHAGIGNIIMARQKQKPMVIVPRQKSLGEHYNDHQLEIAKKLEKQKGFKVVYDIDDLDSHSVINFSEKPEQENIEAKRKIIQTVKDFCHKTLIDDCSK